MPAIAIAAAGLTFWGAIVATVAGQLDLVNAFSTLIATLG